MTNVSCGLEMIEENRCLVNIAGNYFISFLLVFSKRSGEHFLLFTKEKKKYLIDNCNYTLTMQSKHFQISVVIALQIAGLNCNLTGICHQCST